jgi:xanthine dehydrogenase YagS FAD-binding subunit
MRPFTYVRATDTGSALAAAEREPATRYLGGGTNLLDLMKTGVERPAQLVDITRLPLHAVEEHGSGIRIGAMARNSDVANHVLVRQRYPLLSQALVAGASPQLRNMATMGGNLMQRTRCPYFYDSTFPECNKRAPGSGCGARQGYHRTHAILGASEQCIATHPSDMAVALVALDALVQVTGARGQRAISIADFYRLPGETPHLDNNLGTGELITAIDLPALSFAQRAFYLKVRDRSSYAFALVSVGAMLDLDQRGRVRAARLALGGVAHKPWRVPEAERLLVGQPAEERTFEAAAARALEGARPYRDNAFKVELARRSIVRALATAAAIT